MFLLEGSFLAFVLWCILGFLILIGFRIVRPVERGVVERFGKYNRTTEPGLRWMIPVVDRMIKVNITEIQVDLEKQSVITKDNLNLEIDGVVYFRVHDALKALYEVNDYAYSIPSLAQTTLRSVIGEMHFQEVNAQRQTINLRIEKELDQQVENWGINILRVELQDIQSSRDVQIAMDKVVTAEREKEAQITAAIAKKEASKEVAEARVIEAESEKRARIEKATGESEAVKLRATAKAQAITEVNNAVETTFKANAQKFKAMEITLDSLKDNAKFVLTENGITPSIILNETDKVVVEKESKKEV